ncbi:hypothetical protein LCGC14_1517080 [marine sediment metagenome]|uniref:Uncharacterized protein n=1 Tax=marine sediment metagenome TaxID=412755 RepID=A0A0F9IZS7_9ZZZZ
MMAEESPEAIVAEFMGDVSRAVKKHWVRLDAVCGFAGAHIIIGALEQAKQKVVRELDGMLEKVLEEKYFGLEDDA